MNDEPCPSDVTCNVCGSTSQLCTVSSGVAPVSYQLCLRCTEVRAEALSVVGVWIASYGTLEHVPDHSKNLVTFLDGKYIGWPEIQAHFIQNEESIRESMAEEFELSDDWGTPD